MVYELVIETEQEKFLFKLFVLSLKTKAPNTFSTEYF